MHWDYITYDEHICAIIEIALILIILVVQCIGIALLMISIVMTCNRIEIAMPWN